MSVKELGAGMRPAIAQYCATECALCDCIKKNPGAAGRKLVLKFCVVCVSTGAQKHLSQVDPQGPCEFTSASAGCL